MKRWLIIYDIRKPRRLAKVARILEGIGMRVQKSVFEAEADAKAIEAAKRKVLKVIEPAEDFVLFFSLCLPDWEKREKFGREAELPAGREYEIF